MNKRKSREDPVVAEIRAIRAQIWREAGSTGEGLMRYIREHTPSTRAQRKTSRSGTRTRRTIKRRAATPRPKKA